MDTLPAMQANSSLTRLVGNDAEEIRIYEASNRQLYGRKGRLSLPGDLAARARSIGCHPHAYQAISWWTFLGIPVVPLGTYLVLPYVENEHGETYRAVRNYRAIRLGTDRGQITWHYLTAFGLLTVTGGVVWWLCRSAFPG